MMWLAITGWVIVCFVSWIAIGSYLNWEYTRQIDDLKAQLTSAQWRNEQALERLEAVKLSNRVLRSEISELQGG
jgi:hypothetical protein